MKRPLRVAALQLRAHDRAAFGDAYERVARAVERVAGAADLVVLPEGTLPGYVLGADRDDGAAVERALDDLRRLAREHALAIVAGAAVRDGKALYNAGVVIDRDGTIAGRAEKIFLWHFDHQWFQSGTRIAPVETSLGRLGVLICADGRMPGISHALVDAGAEILVMPTAWVSSGRNPHALENPIADLLAQVRAHENGVPFVAADKCGVEREMVLYCGKSQIVSASGQMLAMASERDEEDLVATVTIGDAQPKRAPAFSVAKREPPNAGALRVAVSAVALPKDIDERLRILECPFTVAPDTPERIAALDAAIPVAVVDDAVMNDPTGLGTYRRAGYRLAIWNTSGDDWTERLARARAGELRMYVVVIDRSAQRAYVVDPDYAVVCGTFDGYRIAACAIDIAKTAQTVVVPGTDVAEGLERVHAMTQR